jgi:1-deoxy-D-xylulose-5-phosphate synthase
MFKGVREKYAERGQFVDVGIAEENAMAMASGVARNGGVAVFGTFAPFLQRTYDQLSHDLCLNDNPATILVLSPGVYGMNSNTHIALCDIQEFAHVPNFIYLAPSSTEEYKKMFEFATTQKEHPVGIRVPENMVSSGVEDTTDYSIYNKNKVEQKGSKVALFAVGILVPMAREIAKKVKEEIGLDITVINPLFLTGLDEELLTTLKQDHDLVITIEDGELMGGYGQNIASFYGDTDMKVKNFGISKAFHTDFEAEKLLEENGISVDKITKVIKDYIEK